MDRFLLPPNEGIPNNPLIAVRLYRGVAAGAAAFETIFGAHGWPAQWRDGVFDYHHYHSTAHEVLGCYAGQATLMIGGPGGRRVDLGAGDAIMLPAGTGQRCEGASRDFAVVGAYPKGQEWDIVTDPADDAVRARIAAVPAPPRDPVTGGDF
ncbi:cupin [Sphingomonas sp.]|uniref:cupin n=1 Tax=Sphingomonas sp. TaxID=28214 RepID=UPI003B3B7A2F